MPSRDDKLHKAEARKRELVAERRRIRAAIPRAPHDAKGLLERAVRVTQRLIGKVNQRIRDLQPGPKTMYDDVTLSIIAQADKTPPAVGAYADGIYANVPDARRLFPQAKILTISVSAAGQAARCLDVEPQDATPEQAPAWFRKHNRKGYPKLVFYISVSTVAHFVAVMNAAGIKRSEYLIWTAHYTGRRHRCNKGCGFGMPTTADLTQFTDHSHGFSLDESALKPSVL